MSVISVLPPLIILGGLFVIIRLRAFFILHPIRTIRAILLSLEDRESRRSLFLALAGTLGIGNIVGVAVGISVGGAGSVFWLLVSAIFAAALKYAESSLAADMHTSDSDGMMSVLSASFPRCGRSLASLYAVACILLSLVMGAALQSAGVINSAAHFSLPPLAVGTVFAIGVLAVIILGPERVGPVTAVIIPITTVLYAALALVTIFSNASRVPAAICDVLGSAFSPTSATGGILGFFTSIAVREGFSRGLLSNEAGAGTSSLAHSRITYSPAAAGLLGMCEVFFDTVVLCPLTALGILVSTPNVSEFESGMAVILSGIGRSIGAFSSVSVTLCIAAFAFSTVICWYCYGSRCLSYLGVQARVPYLTVYILATLLGTFVRDRLLISVTDLILLLLSILTLLAIIKNSDRLCRLSENYGLLGYTE